LHPPVASGGIKFIERMLGFELHYVVAFCVYVVGSIAIGVVTTKLTEIPVLRLRDRYFPRRGSIT
jgi:peptidoglycan/LPS O-acetylase OafA/YrhL